jgi:hypothetical protein
MWAKSTIQASFRTSQLCRSAVQMEAVFALSANGDALQNLGP